MVLRRQVFSPTIQVQFPKARKVDEEDKSDEGDGGDGGDDGGGGSGSEDDPGERSETGAKNGAGQKDGTGGSRVDGGARCGSASNHSGGASIGKGGGENAWDTNEYLDGGWMEDSGGGDRGDQSSTDSLKSGETFIGGAVHTDSRKGMTFMILCT